jgi:hypothetical protein
MAKTLFELVQDYLNRRNLPETFTYDRSTTTPPPPKKEKEVDFSATPVPQDPFLRDSGIDSFKNFEQVRKNYLDPFSRIGDVVPGFAGKGLQALQDMLPVNRRAIYENELRNQGVFTDDIGRIVADPTENYNTVENVMAGYNANKITQETIDERVGKIGNRLKEKYNLSDTQVQGLVDGTLSAEQLAEINAKAIMPGTNQTTNLIDQIQAVAEYGRKFVDEQSPVKMKTNVVETQLRLGKGEDVSTAPIAPPSLGFGNPNLDDLGNIEILDIVGGGKKDTIASSKDDEGVAVGDQFFADSPLEKTYGPFSPQFADKIGGVTASSVARAIQQAQDDRATIDNITSAARTGANIAKSRDALAREYDREVARGERKDDPTIQSDINKAKAKIGMPQMLGDVGGGDDKGGGGGKIVCTMMNESYGFGSFRNKIWLRHSKGLAPEYQKGYHKIFLPLVKLSKKNYVLKKVLEHIAVHRTIDIRQESRNKVHLLGRIYRKVLEPICYLVGKYGKD